MTASISCTTVDVVGPPTVNGPHYYYTFTQGFNSHVSSWRVERLKYDLDNPKDLVAFIVEMENTYSNFYLTWWKKLGEPK